jgi:hypothetical protein
MNQYYKGIDPPRNRNAKIWRYMDLAKFTWMLENKALFFANFKTFDDPFEGRFPKETNMSEYIAKQIEASIHDHETFINCWHMNEAESVAMWKLYSDLELSEGVAIQSTYKNLRECLSTPKEKDDIKIGVVKYSNVAKFKYISVFHPFIYKRKSFDYEREIRAILFLQNDYDKSKSDNHNPDDEPKYRKGVPIEIDLNKLIENVYISPKAHECFEKVVKTLLENYEFPDINVIHSTLYDINLY